MISVDYVHASDNEYKIENEYMEHAQELDMMMLEYQVISETADFEAIFEEGAESGKVKKEKEIAIFDAIGKKVVWLVEKVRDLFKTIIDKIKSLLGKNKANYDSVAAIKKAHPEWNDMIDLYSKEFKNSDPKVIADMLKSYKEIESDFQKGSIDSDTFVGKINKLIDNVKGMDTITAGNFLNVTGKTISVVTAAASMPGIIAKEIQQNGEYQRELLYHLNLIQDDLLKEEKKEGHTEVNMVKLRLNAIIKLQAQVNTLIVDREQMVQFLNGKIISFIDGNSGKGTTLSAIADGLKDTIDKGDVVSIKDAEKRIDKERKDIEKDDKAANALKIKREANRKVETEKEVKRLTPDKDNA